MNFYYQSFKQKKFWSNKSHKYYTSKSISDQIWDEPNKPCKGQLLSLNDIIKILPITDDKSKRSAIMRFETDIFPLKEYVGYDKWNGIIFIDLDMIHSNIFCKKIDAVIENDKVVSFNKEKNDKFYKALTEILSNLMPGNFYMIEHSSSHIGLHIMFYYDVEKNENNFRKCAEYTKEILLSKIHNNEYGIIEDFDKMISEPKVIDGIYNRIYQKCYITGIDIYVNNFANGYINNSLLDKYKFEKKEVDVESNYKITVNLDHIKDNIYDVDHNKRFYIYTALKKVTKDKTECNSIWLELCKKFKLYRDYTYKTFINEFDYDSIDESAGRVEILERYGFEVKKDNIYYHLNENQYLGDIRDSLLSNVTVGINFWRAPTGSGKTCFWVDYNKELLNDILNLGTRKPILIVEPLNSIINTKYDGDVVTVTGNKQFPKIFTSYAMYITNYNKLLRKNQDGSYRLRDDIETFFRNFEYIIIDESHIIIKDSFRCEVLIPFVKSLVEVSKYCKVILQTASPMDEDHLFNITNKIEIYKKPKAEIKFITRICGEDKFNIQDITDITKYYLSQNRKVYIYWNNASLNQLNAFKSTYDDPDKIAIYHKRNTGEESMERISKYHYLEYDGEEHYKYDILLSSVYFGVGNDLNDEVKAAVIIIGDNTVQEDIQAIGRWRNSTDIEVCQIIRKNEYDFIESTKDQELNRGLLLSEERQRLNKMWHDKLCKDKSVLIGNKTWQIKNKEDIDILAIMSSAETYYSAFNTKIKMLEDPYYSIRCKYDIDRPLEINTELNEQTKSYWDSVKNIRNIEKRNIIEGKVNYDIINKDTNIEKFNRLWNSLKRYGIDKLISINTICSSTNFNMLNLWVKYYRSFIGNDIDYPELYSLIWYKNIEKSKADSSIELFGKEIKIEEYYCMLAYVLFIHNKNLGVKDYNIKFNYFNTFKWYCKLFDKMPDVLINKFYEGNEYNNDPTKLFFEDVEWKDDDFEKIIIKCIDDFHKQIEHMPKEMNEVSKIIKGCVFLINKKRSEGGKKSSPKKEVKITSEFKHPEKYNLIVGQMFESCEKLAEYTKKSKQSVSKWVSKSWIEKV